MFLCISVVSPCWGIQVGESDVLPSCSLDLLIKKYLLENFCISRERMFASFLKQMPSIPLCEYTHTFLLRDIIGCFRASLVSQMVKNLPAMQETQVQSLGLEDSLEEEMETHSSILAWEIPWKEDLGGLQSMGSQRVRHDWATFTCIGCFQAFATTNNTAVNIRYILHFTCKQIYESI